MVWVNGLIQKILKFLTCWRVRQKGQQMKKLATIECIDDIIKHPNADRLHIATVKGWKCVTAEAYNVGDLSDRYFDPKDIVE